MMAATILLIRHAAHVHLDRRLSGRMPGVSLSDAGREQARALGLRLADEGIDRVGCSPLERTRDTAAAIASACGLAAPEPVEALIEIDMGEWTGAAFDDLHGDPDWDRWNTARGTARIPGGETMAEAQARIAGYLANTAATHGGEVVAAVTHSDMIRAAVSHVLGLSLDNLLRFEIGPASVTRIVAGEWGAKLIELNRTFRHPGLEPGSGSEGSGTPAQGRGDEGRNS
jgi:broad specificity phosphatase PhoE